MTTAAASPAESFEALRRVYQLRGNNIFQVVCSYDIRSEWDPLTVTELSLTVFMRIE